MVIFFSAFFTNIFIRNEQVSIKNLAGKSNVLAGTAYITIMMNLGNIGDVSEKASPGEMK
ncbi:hypothetical protein ES703_15481 [subsurface metagenome]